MDKFNELKAAAMAATPGPWSYNGNCKFGIWWPSENCYVLSANTHDDAAFIAAANPAVVLALLAELEASSLQCRGIEQERELFRLERAAHQNHAKALEHNVAELETYNTKLRNWNAGLAQESCELEAKLATPVRLPDGLAKKIKVTGYYEALNEMMDCVRAAGFKCVGDE